MYANEEVISLRKALSKAQTDLAEVLDECVFAERQRSAAEESLKAAASQVSVDRELLSCLDTMLLYIATIEQQVLLPATTSISSVVAQNLSVARGDVDRRLEIVGTIASVDAPLSLRKALALSDPPAAVSAQAVLKRQEILSGASPLQIEDSFVAITTLMSHTSFLRSLVNELSSKLTSSDKWTTGDEKLPTNALALQKRSRELLEEVVMLQSDGQAQLRLLERVKELEQIVDAHEAERQEVAHRFQVLQRAIESAKQTEFHREQESSLTDELTLLKLQRQHQAETIQSQQDELLSLGRELRESKREHDEQVARLKQQLNETVTLQSASDVDAFIHKVDAGPSRHPSGQGIPQSDVQAYQTKLRAFEMTTAALNNELVNLEDKVVALERKSDDEAAESTRQLGELRRRHKSELDECHDIVSKLTTELDTLLKENTALKQRIKRLPN